MSKYTLLVTFGPRAASADCAQKMAANDTTAKMRDVLAKIILGEEGEEGVATVISAFKDNDNSGVSEDRRSSAH